MLNLSQLFFYQQEKNNFISNIDLPEEKRNQLTSARTLIRQALRINLPNAISNHIGKTAVTRPRFFTQGSYAYKTLNAQAHASQQVDLDDGTYLPLSFAKEIAKPTIASNLYFKAVEIVLADLSEEMGWNLLTNKNTCIRIEISKLAHIDIPLYAIPDNQFSSLEEARKSQLRTALDSLSAKSWDSLPSNSVLLAHRQSGWKPSDPRLLKEWFSEQISLKGEQLRRIVRYLKAFRDQQWISGGPSSTLLMVVAASVFNKRIGRDDLALMDVAEQIPRLLKNGVVNPTQTSERLTDQLDPSELQDAITKFQTLQKDLFASLSQTDEAKACKILCNLFGERFPNNPLVISTDQILSPSESIAHVKSIPWPMYNFGKIEIKTSIHASKNGPYLKSYNSNGPTLEADTWLKFVANHSFTPDVSIRWQIVNTGYAAKNANQLRGEIEGAHENYRWESTRYRGTHWVECFALDFKKKLCLGRSGKFYVNVE